MTVIDKLNSPFMYMICAGIILVVTAVGALAILLAWLQYERDKKREMK